MSSFFSKAQPFLAPAGRVIMGAFFVMAGLQKLMDISGTAGYIESVGFPAGSVLAVLAIIVEIGVGGALLIGYQAKFAALILAVFVLVLTFPFHGPAMWSAENPTQQIMFMKNIVIFGSLLFMAAYAGKDWSQLNKPPANPTPTL